MHKVSFGHRSSLPAAGFSRPRQCLFRPPSAATGFGQASTPRTEKPKGKKKKTRKSASKLSPDQAVQRAVDIAEGGRQARPVTDAEAAKGRLDYVRVKDWGSGDRKDLGSLKVDSVSRVTRDPKQPFYEQLARHLEMCQARGDLQPPANQVLPPFERWAFRRQHYVQYLVDQYTLHRAMEDATMAALQPATGDRSECEDQSEADSSGESSKPLPAFSTEACAALDAFHPADPGSLGRADALSADLDVIAKRSPDEDSNPYHLEAGAHAESYAEHLISTAAAAQDESAGVSAQDAARMQLVAHLYSAHVTHLTTGMRIGAAATEKLDLFQIGATRFYEGYPESMEDPLQYFIAVINQIGQSLSSNNMQLMFAELPGAFLRTSQMLTALAKSK